MGASVNPAVDLAAWRKVCALVSGAALAPTAETLRRSGALDHLARAPRTESVKRVAEAAQLHEGYAHVALGLLVSQGLLARRVPDGNTRDARVRLTPSGRRWVARAEAYDGALERMERARAVRLALMGGEVGVLPEWDDSGPASDAMGERLSLHRLGPVAASIVGGLGRLGALRRLYHAPLGWLGRAEIGVPDPVLQQVLPVLERLGWAACEDDLVALTPEGRSAARWAPLFNYVFGYLGVYESATALLEGKVLAHSPDESRADSDRDLLLTGKSYVFRTGLRGPLHELLADWTQNGAHRPRVVLDMNAGDGTVLAAYADLARGWGGGAETTLIGLVRNPLAEERCRATLARVDGLPWQVLRADFSEPDDVARAVAEQGFSLRDALVVSKTTIHDRRFQGAGGEALLPAEGRPTEAVFVSPEGEWIEPRAMEDDLAAFFARWRRHLGPHGLVAMDTHAVAPEVAARTWPENAVTHVAASHGYSSQYLIECDRFREAARRAGFSSRFRRDLGTDRVQAVTMSLDHFVG